MPDATTICLFCEHLKQAGAIEKLFTRFEHLLQEKGYLARSGQILDASLIAATRQHNSEAEKAAIKEGKTAKDIWPDNRANASHKDTDARWTVKFSKAKSRSDGSTGCDLAMPVFGDKNHVGIDRCYGLIRGWDVSSAALHDIA